MTALVSLADGGSMLTQMEAKLASMDLKSPGLNSNVPSSPSARTFNTSATNRQSLAFDSSPSSLSPGSTNSVGNPSDVAATLAQQRAKLKAASNTAHSIPAPALASSCAGERGTWAGVSSLGQDTERGSSPTDMTVETRSSRPPSTDFSSPAFRSLRLDGDVASLDGLSPAMSDSWASIMNTPLLPMFLKPSSSAVNTNNATSHGQTVDLATTKLNDLYGAGNVPRLNGPEKFRRSSKGHMHDDTSGGSTAVNVTNNDVYGNDGDLISGHRASSQGSSGGRLRNGGGGGGSGSNWSGAQSPVLSNNSGRFGSSDDGSQRDGGCRTTSGACRCRHGRRQVQPRPRLSRPMRHADRAQHGTTGTAERDERNPFNIEHARHGESQRDGHIARGAAPRGADYCCWRRVRTAWPRARRWTRRYEWWSWMRRTGSDRRSFTGPQQNGSSAAGGNNGGGGGAKKDEEDFDPAVLNDVAGWLRSLRLHKYTPNFEGMSWKEMVLMDEQAL